MIKRFLYFTLGLSVATLANVLYFNDVFSSQFADRAARMYELGCTQGVVLTNGQGDLNVCTPVVEAFREILRDSL